MHGQALPAWGSGAKRPPGRQQHRSPPSPGCPTDRGEPPHARVSRPPLRRVRPGRPSRQRTGRVHPSPSRLRRPVGARALVGDRPVVADGRGHRGAGRRRARDVAGRGGRCRACRRGRRAVPLPVHRPVDRRRGLRLKARTEMSVLTHDRRAAPTALRLLASSRSALREAQRSEGAPERYATADLAALRAAAAVIAARVRPGDVRRRPTSAWVLLAAVAPELGEWASYFAAGAEKRAAPLVGLRTAVTPREADDLWCDAHTFLALVETTLGVLPS